MKLNIFNLCLKGEIKDFNFERFMKLARFKKFDVQYNPETDTKFPNRCIIKIDNVTFSIFKTGKMIVYAKNERVYRHALDKLLPIIRWSSDGFIA